MKKEEQILEKYLQENGMRQSKRRNVVLRVFLSQEKHLTADELYDTVMKKDPSIGRATVYRTMKVLCDCGLARETQFSDGITYYEHNYLHNHHDHLVCNKCNTFVEVIDERIEKLQEQMATKKNFIPQSHTMIIYGICRKCAD